MLWYAVHTKSHQESYAALNLATHGIETFCPKIRQKKVIRRTEQVVAGPLFPGYLFARFDTDTQYRAVAYARGVKSIVAFGAVPAVVDEEIIESIRSRMLEGYLTVPSPSFKRGETVRIQAGPLHGLEAIFEQAMSDRQRAVLLLRTLAYQARLVVPLQHLVHPDEELGLFDRCLSA
jgi:transcriptional antiterminator RfaH